MKNWQLFAIIAAIMYAAGLASAGNWSIVIAVLAWIIGD